MIRLTEEGKKFFGTIAAAMAIVIAIIAITSFSKGSEKQKPPKQVDLNNVLTNEMSDTSSLEKLDKAILNYMAEWNLQGTSLAIMRNDSLVYAKGYGWADKAKDQKMGPGNILRVASVSKLITAAGIMLLQERGMLDLSGKVFGDEGILNDSTFTQAIKDKNCLKITVEDLLRHKGGFNGRYGDPMFSTRTIMLQNHLSTPPDHETLVKIVLKRPLGFVPGTSQYYSNFGYLLLSMIIEKVSGMDYERFIQDNILLPAGCTDMHIGNNYYADKYKNESRYYMQSNDEKVDEYNNSGKRVERCYGGNDIRALAGAGAWVTSAPELAKFVAAIDGRDEFPDVLSPESVKAMTEYFDEETYSLGWNDTNPEIGWTRTGTLSGTSALIKYFPDGECWILISNTSTWKGPTQTKYTSTLFSNLRSRFSDIIPHRNFFYEEEPEDIDTKDKGKDKKKNKDNEED
ncbi:MAG: beta-lactamase family protein [Bacteroidales bacterium]|nr:beta-lactamase family protein [Bacteroidales bacterium]